MTVVMYGTQDDINFQCENKYRAGIAKSCFQNCSLCRILADFRL